jgi:hypothetical protein
MKKKNIEKLQVAVELNKTSAPQIFFLFNLKGFLFLVIPNVMHFVPLLF